VGVCVASILHDAHVSSAKIPSLPLDSLDSNRSLLMESLPPDDIEENSGDLPPGIAYLLDKWHPKKLLIRERNPNSISMLPPASTTANTASTITHRSAGNTPRHTGGKNKKNRTTRPASFYDKHLALHLILQRVKLLDSLVDSITGTVDKAIKDALSHGPLPPADSTPTEKSIISLTTRSRIHVLGEEGVAEYYKDLTARFCLPVASTLALHPTLGEWASLLSWTREPNAAGWAIADGALELNLAPDVDSMDSYENDLNHVYPDIRDIWDELLDKYPDLAIWEMKSLQLGTLRLWRVLLSQLVMESRLFGKTVKSTVGGMNTNTSPRRRRSGRVASTLCTLSGH
jgi:hypothetical protein